MKVLSTLCTLLLCLSASAGGRTQGACKKACGDVRTHVLSSHGNAHPCQKARGSHSEIALSACYSGAKKAFEQACVPTCTGASLSVDALKGCKAIAKRSNNASSWCQKGYTFIQQQLPPNLDGYFAEEENKEAVQEKTDGDAVILGKTDGHTRTETESTDSSNEKTDLTDKAGPAIHEASIHKEGTEKNVLATKADSDEEPATENPDTLLAVDIEAAHPPGKQETVVREADKEEKDEIDPVEKGAATSATAGKTNSLPHHQPTTKSSLRPANGMTVKAATQAIQEKEPQTEGSKSAEESVAEDDYLPEPEESDPEPEF